VKEQGCNPALTKIAGAELYSAPKCYEAEYNSAPTIIRFDYFFKNINADFGIYVFILNLRASSS